MEWSEEELAPTLPLEEEVSTPVALDLPLGLLRLLQAGHLSASQLQVPGAVGLPVTARVSTVWISTKQSEKA